LIAINQHVIVGETTRRKPSCHTVVAVTILKSAMPVWSYPIAHLLFSSNLTCSTSECERGDGFIDPVIPVDPLRLLSSFFEMFFDPLELM
jgi:hypothetical protein